MVRTSTLTGMIFAMVLLFTFEAGAWDGQRKGFVLGIGAGAGLSSYKLVSDSYSQIESDRFNKTAFMTDFKIGFAPSNRVMIFWASKVSWFGHKVAEGTEYETSFTATNGIGGLGTSYFFQPGGPSPYLTGTIGFSTWSTPFEANSDSYFGGGFSLGAGYEFSKHWSVEGNFSWGSPSDDFGDSVSTNAVRVTVNVLGY